MVTRHWLRPNSSVSLLAAGVALLSHLNCHDAEAKMVMGIADGQDYYMVSTFCFTFPEAQIGVVAPNGHIHSQTIVASDGHKLLVLNYTELYQGLSCDELVRRAKVIEPLSERTKEVIAYDLTLNVEPSMDRQHVAAVIARCGQTVSAEYILEFTNPGNSLQQHFACSDQGLLTSYVWFSLLAAGVAPAFYSALRVLHRRQAHNDVSALFFTSSAFFGARIWLFTVHLLVYARNGMGLGMLLFVAQFLDFLSNTLVALVLVALVHGVYVTRPCVPPASEERRSLLQMVGGYTATYLISTLACGFKVDGPLTPFGVLRGSASWPHVFARLLFGAFCISRSLRLAAEDSVQAKKGYILRFGVLAAAYLWAMPVVMLFSGEDSWHRDAVVLDIVNVFVYSILLYDFWPTRFGALFSCIKPTETMHPYAEFGLSD